MNASVMCKPVFSSYFYNTSGNHVAVAKMKIVEKKFIKQGIPLGVISSEVIF